MDRKGIYRLGSKSRERCIRMTARGAAVIALMLLSVILILNRQFFPFVSEVAESEAKNKIVGMLEEAVLREMEQGMVGYSDIVRLSYKSDGNVAALECDLPTALGLRARIARDALEKFRDESLMYVSVPLGSVSGIELLSGRGPSIDIRLVLAHGIRVYIGSEFREAGINQTLHRVTVCFDVEISVLTPTHSASFTVNNSYPIAETVIVGDVPDAYTKIDRLTDDITEEEIDDIYDFGAAAE